MTNDPYQQLDQQDIGDDERTYTNTNTTAHHLRKRDKVREFLGIPKTKDKELKNKLSNQLLNAGLTAQAVGLPLVASQVTRPSAVASQPKDTSSDDKKSIYSSAPANNPFSEPSEAKSLSVVSMENLPKPAFRTALPTLLERIEMTEQLVYCHTLILQVPLLKTTANAAEETTNTPTNTAQTMSTLTDKELEWLTELDKNPVEKAHIRWLATRMVEEFIQDPNKDSVKIAEIVALGPVLGREPYRKLLSSITDGFEDAHILDTDMLQGLIQLVQSASPGFIDYDDLVKIFRVLRIHLQGTHQQSSEHSFHLTLAVSRVLDVMVEHEVKDLNRVEEYETLSSVLSGLKGSSDPYLMYQACHAFQALLYVPGDETALEAVPSHSTGVVDGLVKVSAMFKLDLGAALEGLEKLQEALGGVIGTASTVYEGVCTVMESGQGVLEGMKEGLGSGKKRPWYAAIRAAHALVQAGQLKDLNRLIYEAPCRCDPLFQWGICQILGEIATDALWNAAVRQHAVDVLGQLYKDDVEWGQDKSVKTWMLNIINQLGTIDNQVISTRAHTLLKELKQDQVATTCLPYPLRNQLPLPTSSPILARVQDIPLVDYDLHKLRLQRLDEHMRALYIPPQAKPSLQASDNNVFPLMEKALEFLASHRQVFLVLGDSGAGKSTFNLKLEHTLWKDYKHFGPVPLYINLPTIDDPALDLIEKQLQYHNFSDDQIQEMKLHREFVLICDGYDESQLKVNLHVTNQFNQPGQWKVKMVISCRSQYLGQDYYSRFQPQSVDHYQHDQDELFAEVVVAAFSRAQIQQYVEEYVKELPGLDPIRNKPSWSAEEYMDKLVNIPHLMELVSNPFLLSLSLDALPAVVKSEKDLSAIRITRAQLYDSFVKRWLEVNRRRLEESPLSVAERSELDLLVEDDFFFHGIHFQKQLASAIFIEHAGNPVVRYTHLSDKGTWKASFFAPEGQTKLLRESSTVMRTGSFFRFLHRSLLEYFYSRTIYDPRDYDFDTNDSGDRESAFNSKTCLGRMSVIKEPSILQFLAERVSQDPLFQQQLQDVIRESKADVTEGTNEVAAANAISVLVKAGILFNDADLRRVKIPGADLSNGQFDSAQFQGSDLKGVNFSSVWLRKADMTGARLEGVGFGELPYLEEDDYVTACVYSPDGRMLALASQSTDRCIYDTSTWKSVHRLKGTFARFDDIAFSPDSRQFVCGGEDYTVRLFDCINGEEVLIMQGHTYNVLSVAFSPSGKQIASASHDDSVRLWDSQTGESLFVLQAHTGGVISVKYSPDGRQLVSASWDETIRFWDPETGEPGVVLNPSFEGMESLAFSPDGRWIASGHESGVLQLWDTVSKEPGLVLSGHTEVVTRIAFSSNSQLLASSSQDKTVKLWDVSTGTLVSTTTGHSNFVNCVAFSPDGFQIASGGWDKKLRLWEVRSSWSSLDQRDGGCVGQAVYALDGQSILSYDARRNFRQWNTATGAYVSISIELPGPKEVSATAYSLDGGEFAVGYEDFSIRLWNCRTGTAGLVLGEHSSQIELMVYSQCCRWIASVDENNYLRLWDRQDSGYQSVLVEPNEEEEVEIGGVGFSSTGTQLAIGACEGSIYLYDTGSKEFLSCTQLIEEDGNLMTLAYSPNDQQIAFGTGGGTIYLWDLQSEEPSAKLEGHKDWIRSIAYSPCGQWIASGSRDWTVILWRRQLLEEEESWAKVYSIHAFFATVESVSWNPVVPLELVTGSQDGSVRVWRVLRGDDDEGSEPESVEVKLIWGSNLGILCADGLALKNATGLNSFDRKLLTQRGAVGLKKVEK